MIQYVLIHVNPFLCCFFMFFPHLPGETVNPAQPASPSWSCPGPGGWLSCSCPLHWRSALCAGRVDWSRAGTRLWEICSVSVGFLGRSWQFVRTEFQILQVWNQEVVWCERVLQRMVKLWWLWKPKVQNPPLISCHPPYRPYRSASAVGKNDGSVMEHRCALAERRTCQIDIDWCDCIDAESGYTGRHINVCDSHPLHESDMRFPTCYFEIFWVVGH